MLGAEHPDTLRTMRYLIVLFGKQGRMDNALPLVRALNKVHLQRADTPGAIATEKKAISRREQANVA